MSWSSWLRNLFGARDPGPATPAEALETREHDPLAAAAPPALHVPGLRIGVVSEVGNVREHNEDNYFVPGRLPVHLRPAGDASSQPSAPPLPEGPGGLFIVADGMGGQLAGEKASKMAVEIIPRELGRRLDGADDARAIQGAIRDAVAEANKEILALSHLETEYANMGTTVVLALLRDDRAYIAGIGDSRAYRLRDGRLELLTTDHSLAKALVEAGTITPEEEETHKFRNVLYLYLGSKDARGGPEQVRVLETRPGDRFLLASDGLTGVVKEAEITELLRSHDDPQRAAQLLFDRAMENLSRDNVTCVVVHVV